MKYLNRSFSISMPGNKGHWPWADNVTEDPSAGNNTLSPEDWEEADAIKEHGGEA